MAESWHGGIPSDGMNVLSSDHDRGRKRLRVESPIEDPMQEWSGCDDWAMAETQRPAPTTPGRDAPKLVRRPTPPRDLWDATDYSEYEGHERTPPRSSYSFFSRARTPDHRLADLENENQALKHEVATLRRELEMKTAQASQIASQLAAEKRQLASTTQLLDTRTKEWHIAQQFLTTADSLTEADVVRMVTRLNSENFQFAGQLANDLSPDARRNTPSTVTRETAQALGTELLKVLHDSRAAADPSAVIQVAVQAVLVNACTRMISSWHSSNSFDRNIKILYETLQHDGESLIVNLYRESVTKYVFFFVQIEPSVAGKWRALTRSSLDRLNDKDLDSQLVDVMSTTLSSVLTAAGFDYPAHSTTLKRDLTLISKLTMEIKRAIAAIESCDMEVFLCPTDTPFDSKVMGKSFQEKRTITTNVAELLWTPVVFRTTEMGLRGFKRVDGRTRGTQRAWDILLQPTVVLKSDLQHLL